MGEVPAVVAEPWAAGTVPGAPEALVAVTGGWGVTAEPSRWVQTPLDFTAWVNLMKKITKLSPLTECLGTSQSVVVVVTDVDIVREYSKDDLAVRFLLQGARAHNLKGRQNSSGTEEL